MLILLALDACGLLSAVQHDERLNPGINQNDLQHRMQTCLRAIASFIYMHKTVGPCIGDSLPPSPLQPPSSLSVEARVATRNTTKV